MCPLLSQDEKHENMNRKKLVSMFIQNIKEEEEEKNPPPNKWWCGDNLEDLK